MASYYRPGFLPLPPSPRSDRAQMRSNYTGDHSEELWQACAGPLVYVPKTGDKVWYFPQGHMEQVAASTAPQSGSSLQSLPNSGLDSQILCRVVHRTLSAERETDEVYAQISLLPIAPELGDISPPDPNKREAEAPPPPSPSPSPAAKEGPQRSVRLFTKILTASDTSTHGGFSVLRKHAEECLPPLDMAQDTPSQELVAKDLHGHEWKFRHTYRGHPRRHLLTTGWSVFVSSKKLLAGDAVIFLRGENGDLRVGIRRAKRQQTVQQAVMSSHSMHMGVVATANHAIGTRTMFSVFYKPRVSLSAFLVPVDKLAKAVSVSLSVGMRFKMRFETDDASDRNCVGTITGLEDLDATNWPKSKWRAVKVNWDENNSSEWPDRVSPWEIELSVSSPMVNPPPNVSRNKRIRPLVSTPTATEFAGLNSGSQSQFSRVLQGQETRNVVVRPVWRSSQENPHSHLMHVQQQHPGGVSGNPSLPLPTLRTPFYTTYSSSQAESVASPRVQQAQQQHGVMDGHGFPHGSTWTSLLSFKGPSNPPIWQDKALVSIGTAPQEQQQQHQQPHQQQQQYQHQQHHYQHQQQSLHIHPNSSFSLWEATNQQEKPASVPAPPTIPAPSVESGCKLFGISLTDSLGPPKPTKPMLQVDNDGVSTTHALHVDNVVISTYHAVQVDSGVTTHNAHHVHNVVNAHATTSHADGNEAEVHKPVKSDATSEPDRTEQNVGESRCSTRSRIKVIKKGSMVGRGIDLTRFDNYVSLLEELESMFNMKGELTDPSKGWQVAYSDSDGDTMQVGDDPWMEFCGMVKKLYIISPEEIEKGDGPCTKEGYRTGEEHGCSLQG